MANIMNLSVYANTESYLNGKISTADRELEVAIIGKKSWQDKGSLMAITDQDFTLVVNVDQGLVDEIEALLKAHKAYANYVKGE